MIPASDEQRTAWRALFEQYRFLYGDAHKRLSEQAPDLMKWHALGKRKELSR